MTKLKFKRHPNDKHQRIKSHDATNYLFRGFRHLGVNPPKTWHQISYIIYSALVNLAVCVFLPTAFAISLVINEMEFGHFLSSLQTALSVNGSILKFIIVVFALPRLRKTEAIMDRLDARCVDEREKDMIRNIVKFGNRVVTMFLTTFFSWGICINCCSFIMGYATYSLYIPFVDWRRSYREFVIAQLVEFIVTILGCYQDGLNDSYALVYVGILRTHIQALLLRISKLGSDPRTIREENTDELINCIIDHKNIIQLYDIIHPVISATVFVQFMITSLLASIILINVMFFADFVTRISSIIYLVSVTLQILPLCFYGNCLMEDSDRFTNTIFHTNWIQQDVKFRKMLVFFMQRTQKTMTLTAGRIFPITLNTFVGIAKFSFSLFTLLSEMDFNRK